MKHFKSVFYNEQKLLKAIIDIHLNGSDIEADFTYYKGNFYKDGVNRPKYCFDINPLYDFVIKRDTSIYYFGDVFTEGYRSIIIDPPFMIGNRNSQKSIIHQEHMAYIKTLLSLKMII